MTDQKAQPAKPVQKPAPDTRENMRPEGPYKPGQYLGYYEQLVDKDGNLVFLADGSPAPDRSKWVTELPVKNELSPEESALINQTINDYHSGPKNLVRALLRDMKQFFMDFSILFKDGPARD